MLGGQWGQRYLCCGGDISVEFRRMSNSPEGQGDPGLKKQQNKNKNKTKQWKHRKAWGKTQNAKSSIL